MYTCIYNHRRECDGCGRCDEPEEQEIDRSDYDHDRWRDDEYIRWEESEC